MSPNSINLTPLASLKVSRHYIPRHISIPNTSIQNKPLLIYHQAFNPSSQLTPSGIEEHIQGVGMFIPQWRYTVYRTTHFHSTTHELLVVYKGRARLLFGGEDNPGKVEVEVSKGDAILIPAGVGHRLLEDKEGGFEMVGSYPVGAAKWDMCYGKEGGSENADERISKLGWMDVDPLYGREGPAVES
ncbi:hypothetical protein ABKN59_002838 [Abortiporus biennis]